MTKLRPYSFLLIRVIFVVVVVCPDECNFMPGMTDLGAKPKASDTLLPPLALPYQPVYNHLTMEAHQEIERLLRAIKTMDRAKKRIRKVLNSDANDVEKVSQVKLIVHQTDREVDKILNGAADLAN